MPGAIRNWVNIGLAHGHDFALQAHLHTVERRHACGAFFPLEIGTARQGLNMRDDRINPSAATSDGAVDTLFGEQQRAANPLRFAQVQKRPLQRGRVIKAGKVI